MKTRVVNFFDEDHNIMMSINSEVATFNYGIDNFENLVDEMYNLNEIDELQHETLIDKCATFEAIKYIDKGGNTIEL